MKKGKKIFIFAFIFFIFIMLAIMPNGIFAKTSSYGQDVTYNDAGSSNVSKWVGDILLGALGKAIYAIAWVIEKLIVSIVFIFTGVAVFPWSDRVIFNSMPILDVNFINPAESSLFRSSAGTLTTIGEAVRNVYFSGISIGLGFFGIIVAVMAIKLALASIASEKAKYKEAITKWLTALILLFAMHYIISFVFYLNEQLVEVASKIVTGFLSKIQSSNNWYTNTFSITTIADFFKEKAVTEWNTDSFIAALMYAAFIVQSLMFFYAYVKRLLFVVMLAVIAPFVVVYDFMQKAIS